MRRCTITGMSDKVTFSGEPRRGFQVNQRIVLEPRPGMEKTIYYYSYSGGIVASEPLPVLAMHLNETLIEISPARLGHASFRATPQFTNKSFEQWFGGPPSFPVQMAA